MTNRLARSVPFWVLLLASLASIGIGLWLVLTKVSEMSATLADGSATYEQVYVSPAWIGFGGVLVGAGILGLRRRRFGMVSLLRRQLLVGEGGVVVFEEGHRVRNKEGLAGPLVPDSEDDQLEVRARRPCLGSV